MQYIVSSVEHDSCVGSGAAVEIAIFHHSSHSATLYEIAVDLFFVFLFSRVMVTSAREAISRSK